MRFPLHAFEHRIFINAALMGFAMLCMVSASVMGQSVRTPVRTQVRAPVRAPSAPPDLLTPPPHHEATGLPFDIANAPPATASGLPDPFLNATREDFVLRPWNTIAVPFGSWGEAQGWDATTLESSTIRPFRKKAIQAIELNALHFGRGDAASFGVTSASASITSAIPLGSMDRLLVLKPAFRHTWLDGPVSAGGLPSGLYSTSIDIGARLELGEHTSVIGGVQPGWYNDGESSSSGFRLGGLLLITRDVIPDILTVAVGFVRLDRNDVDFIPAAGLTWKPSSDLRLDLMFPKPKLAWRVGHIPWMQEDWIYVTGGFGGGTWAVLNGGREDELTIGDWRIGVGLERLLDGGGAVFIDGGFAFARRLELRSETQERPGDDTFYIEVGMKF